MQSIALENNTTTLANEFARQGKNWKTELEQIKKEQDMLKRLGIEKKKAADRATKGGV